MSQSHTTPESHRYTCAAEGCPGNHASKWLVCESQKYGPSEAEREHSDRQGDLIEMYRREI